MHRFFAPAGQVLVDKIIIEDLKRIILMQAQELAKIPLLIAEFLAFHS